MAIRPTLRGAFCALLASSCVLAAPTTARADCADADLHPTAENLEQIRNAVVCLHNEERAARGLKGLRADAKLRRAANRHSGEMVEKSYFSHDSQDGSDFVDRILEARYVGIRLGVPKDGGVGATYTIDFGVRG